MKTQKEELHRISRLDTIRKIIFDTMELIAERRRLRPDYGWIDLKLDALTGTDYFDIPGVRDRNHVYSWIQGRGLEALTAHLTWLPRFSGFPLPDSDVLGALAHSTAEKLWRARELNRGHLYFLIRGDGPSEESGDSRYTMSDLFCARGLYAYAAAYGEEGRKREARDYLKAVVRAVVEGSFYNDQRSFGGAQYRAFEDGRKSYAGQMISLGGISLLMRLEADGEAPELGRRLVDYVLERHLNRGRRWDSIAEDHIVEWIDTEGRPTRDADGRVVLDLGHALEFVGLAAQMIQAYKTSYELKDEDRWWTSTTLKQLRRLLEVNLEYGWNPRGGIPKGVDAENREAVNPDMPWWPIPETLRAIALMEVLEEGPDWTAWGGKWFDTCLDAFVEGYRKPSACPIPLQAIDGEGRPVAVIPATPDLDPGYHTGLSLMDCYDVLARSGFFTLDQRQVDISPRIGTRLSGHAGRRNPSEAILDSLFARIALLRTPYTRVAVMTADLLELGAETVDDLRRALAPGLGVEETHILISTTHTHTAPPVIDLGSLRRDKEYLNFLRDELRRETLGLGDEEVPVNLRVLRFSLPLGMNRRGRDPETGQIKMRPNPAGSRDDEILAAVFFDSPGKPRSIWVQTAVHPTTLGVSISAVSADYPGSMAAEIRRRLGEDVVVLPFTGACGEVRPALLTPDGKSFRSGTCEDVRRIGKTIAEAIVKALKESAEDPPQKLLEIRVSRKMVHFPFKSIPTAEDLVVIHRSQARRLKKAREEAQGLNEFARLHENPIWEIEAERVWLIRLLSLEKIPPSAEAELVVLRLCREAALCMVPGELFSTLGKKIKALAPNILVMVVGYANGSLGYLPGRDSLAEGGYEVDVAYKYYGLPGPFTEELEEEILRSFGEMLA